MIIEIVYDIRLFIFVLLIAVVGFANGFFILAMNSVDVGSDKYFTGSSFGLALTYSYRMGLGDFDVGDFATRDQGLILVLWFVNTFFILIVLLNLLIALMGDTFDKVQETAENSMLKELTQIMRENEFLFQRKKIFKKFKYIIIVELEKASDEGSFSWEGRMSFLKKFIEESMNDQTKVIKKMEKNIEKIVERKMKEEITLNNNAIQTKFDSLKDKLDEKLDIIIKSNQLTQSKINDLHLKSAAAPITHI
jgi:hypothetical protein